MASFLIHFQLQIIIFLIPLFGTKTVPRILEQYSINIWAERHRSVQTLYCSANTKLRVSYMNIPSRSRATRSEILGEQPCAVSLKVHLLKDYQPRRVLCLYRDSEETNKIFEKDFSIDVEGIPFTKEKLYENVKAVIGFIPGEPNSVVKGYLLKNQFYGTIRLYDKFRLYHIIFFVEPISSAGLYSQKYLTDTVAVKNKDNAIIFEYVSTMPDAQWLHADTALNPSDFAVKVPSGPPVTTVLMPSPVPTTFVPSKKSGSSTHLTTAPTKSRTTGTTGISKTQTANTTVYSSTVTKPQLHHSTIFENVTTVLLTTPTKPVHSTENSPTVTTTTTPILHSTEPSTSYGPPVHSTDMAATGLTNLSPLHSTEGPQFIFHHSTDISPPTTGTFLYYHSTEATPFKFFTHHSTDVSPLTTLTTTTLAPRYHSTEKFSPSSVEPIIHSTEVTFAQFLNHSTEASTRSTILPVHSTEVPTKTTTAVTTTPEPTTVTNRPDLSLSTDIKSTTTASTVNSTVTTAIMFSTEVTDISSKFYHSTESDIINAAIGTAVEVVDSNGTVLLKGEIGDKNYTHVLVTTASDPSDDLRGLKVVVLGPNSTAVANGTIVTVLIKGSTSAGVVIEVVQTDAVTDRLIVHSTIPSTIPYHSTQITIPQSMITANQTTSAKSSTPMLEHSTEAYHPPIHSTDLPVRTRTTLASTTTRINTTVYPAVNTTLTTGKQSPRPSTSGLFHSTQAYVPPVHSTAITGSKSLRKTSVLATAKATSMRTTVRSNNGTTKVLYHSTEATTIPFHSTEATRRVQPTTKKGKIPTSTARATTNPPTTKPTPPVTRASQKALLHSTVVSTLPYHSTERQKAQMNGAGINSIMSLSPTVEIQYMNGTKITNGKITSSNATVIVVQTKGIDPALLGYDAVLENEDGNTLDVEIVAINGNEVILKPKPVKGTSVDIKENGRSLIASGEVLGQNATHINVNANVPNGTVGQNVTVDGPNGTMFEGIVLSVASNQTIIKGQKVDNGVGRAVVVKSNDNKTIANGTIQYRSASLIVVKPSVAATDPKFQAGLPYVIEMPDGASEETTLKNINGSSLVFAVKEPPVKVQLIDKNSTVMSATVTDRNDTSVVLNPNPPQKFRKNEPILIQYANGTNVTGIIADTNDTTVLVNTLPYAFWIQAIAKNVSVDIMSGEKVLIIAAGQDKPTLPPTEPPEITTPYRSTDPHETRVTGLTGVHSTEPGAAVVPQHNFSFLGSTEGPYHSTDADDLPAVAVSLRPFFGSTELATRHTSAVNQKSTVNQTSAVNRTTAALPPKNVTNVTGKMPNLTGISAKLTTGSAVTTESSVLPFFTSTEFQTLLFSTEVTQGSPGSNGNQNILNGTTALVPISAKKVSQQTQPMNSAATTTFSSVTETKETVPPTVATKLQFIGSTEYKDPSATTMKTYPTNFIQSTEVPPNNNMSPPPPPAPAAPQQSQPNANVQVVPHSTEIPMLNHSTEASAPADDESSTVQSDQRRKRRRRRSLFNFNLFFGENAVEEDIDAEDINEAMDFSSGFSSSDLFDIRHEKTSICSLCLWIQPHFAEVFGLGGGLLHGISEVISIINFTDWIFRALDFNQDGIPENIGFKIRKILLSDHVKISADPGSSPPSSGTATSGRKRRHAFAFGKRKDKPQDMNNIFNYFLNQRPKRQDYFEDYYDEFSKHLNQTSHDYSGKSGADILSAKLNNFTRDPKILSPKSALSLARDELESRFSDCCAILGFIYHDMAPSIAATNRRTLCSASNVALVSGFAYQHKVTKMDVFRGVMHALGHLFGAGHDSYSDPECFDKQIYDYLNPFTMHPIQQTNVGMRPNSLRFSICAKDQIAMFLSSSSASCLVEEEESFCGNGVLDEGEACDCGSPWQCHLTFPCCGERDTFQGCQIVNPLKNSCHRPAIW